MSPISIKSGPFKIFIAILRVLIGWHFLYEGLVKVFNPDWTARPFLENSRWIFGDFFRWMISTDSGMWIIDFANEWGLTLIGLALILGIFTRIAAWGGVALLTLYYVAYPPFGGYSYGAPSEGAYMLVNKNLIEIFALIILAMTGAGHYFGLDKYRWNKKVYAQGNTPLLTDDENEVPNSRRELIKSMAGIPLLAVFSGAFFKNLSDTGPDTVSGATIKVDFKQVKDLKGKLPEGKLGDLTITRMVMGCNLIGGWSHARDLLYANKLFKAYNSERKVIETLYLAEQAGINTIFMVTQYYPTFNKYKKIYNSKMQSICQAMLPDKDFFSDINAAIDFGATAIYIQGGEGDRYMKAGKADEILKAVQYIKQKGFLAGVGAHALETIKACEEHKIPVDFYVKTLHQDNYWSSTPLEGRVEYGVINESSADRNQLHDNMWDLFPEQTIEYMKTVSKPWFAFKVLAAGAIQPKEGFKFAFENGADFIVVGMFDFQVIDDVNIACETLSGLKVRERSWYS